MKYFVRVGSDDHQVVIDGEHLKLDGHPVHAELSPVPNGSGFEWVATVDGRVYRVVAQRAGDHAGGYTLDLSGTRLQVEAIDERRRAIERLSGSAQAATGPKPLIAPMPGMIIRVNVVPGDHVRAGQGLVVMEAMKMENELRAPADGTVKAVRVNAGAAVEKGALLIELA